MHRKCVDLFLLNLSFTVYRVGVNNMYFSKLNTFKYFVQLKLSQNVCVFVQIIETENFVEFNLLKSAFSGVGGGGGGEKVKRGGKYFS